MKTTREELLAYQKSKIEIYKVGDFYISKIYVDEKHFIEKDMVNEPSQIKPFLEWVDLRRSIV